MTEPDLRDDLGTLLLPGWRHPTSKKLHIRPECPAMKYSRSWDAVLIRFDEVPELKRADCCGFCFAWYD
jgi:hypothetical protein